MRVAVTGAGGFIGSHLVPSLLAAGHTVRAMVHGHRESPAKEGVGIVQGDVLDLDSLKGCLLGTAAVVHLAAILREPHRLEAVNGEGTRNVLRACETAGVMKLVHLSAQGAGPSNPSRFLRSKALGEEAVRASDLRWTILRPSLVLGPGSGFSERLERVSGRRRVPIIGRGTNLVQPVHVDDLCAAILLCLEEPRAEGGIFEIGGAERIQVGDLVVRLAGAVGNRGEPFHIPVGLAKTAAILGAVTKRSPITSDEVTMATQDNVCDNSALQALGFRPSHDLEDMVHDSTVKPGSNPMNLTP